MGALTLKVFSNELREWEFIEGEALDPTDSFGVSLRLSLRENQIYLAEPFDPENPWITDKARLFFDGMFKIKEKPTTEKKMFIWEDFYKDISELFYFIDLLNFQKKASSSSFIFIFENLSVDLLSILYFLEQSCSLIKLRKSESYNIKNDLELNYQLNNSVDKLLLDKSNLMLLVNTNPRHEGYVLNLNLRQRFLRGNFKVLSLGSLLNLTFPTINLGSNTNVLGLISEGVHLVCQDFKISNFPFLVTNTEFFKRDDAKLVYSIFTKSNIIQITSDNINILNHSLSSVGVNTLSKFLPISFEDFHNSFGFYFVNTFTNSSSSLKQFTELYLLNILSNKLILNLNNKIFVDQNSSFGNNSLFNKLKGKIYDKYFYLPSNLFLEESETFINTQGLIKHVTKLISFKKNAKSNWKILRKFGLKIKSLTFLNQKKDNNLVSFDGINSINFKNYAMFSYYVVNNITSLCFYLVKQNFPNFKIKLKSNFKNIRIKFYATKLKYWLDDFYTSNGRDSFTHNSSVLMNCSKILRVSSTNFF